MTLVGEMLLRRCPPDTRVVLGSRSPRRLELLRQIFPAHLIEVVSPRSPAEASFAGLEHWPAIEARLLEIARAKFDDVQDQLGARPEHSPRFLIAADTVVVVQAQGGGLRVLGQPPVHAGWREVVREWFRTCYAGQTHTVATALCVSAKDPQPTCRIVKTDVTFRDDVEPWLESYLDSGEPSGKAGGYAIQGAGSIFVSRVGGSLSNVVGLPLEALLETLASTFILSFPSPGMRK